MPLVQDLVKLFTTFLMECRRNDHRLPPKYIPKPKFSNTGAAATPCLLLPVFKLRASTYIASPLSKQCLRWRKHAIKRHQTTFTGSPPLRPRVSSQEPAHLLNRSASRNGQSAWGTCLPGQTWRPVSSLGREATNPLKGGRLRGRYLPWM